MKILAIETSCDETAIALMEAKGGLNNPRFKIFKNLVASQIKIHRPFGGVVPSLAKREHLRNLPIVLGTIAGISNFQFPISGEFLIPQFLKLKKFFNEIDLIAVTVGPGLEPALWTGINFAEDLYKELKIKNKELRIIGVSHLEGHLYSYLLTKSSKLKAKSLFPAIALIISGGHTTLLLIKDLTHHKKIGETRDDAVGEAFDKVARLLNLPYPGGPEIEKIAQKGNFEEINFPRPMINQKNYDFSFSGLKTAVLYYFRDQKPKAENYKLKADIAASFQKAAFDVLISKTLRAAGEFNAKSIMISGGVAANKTLKKEFQKAIKTRFSNSMIPRLLITEFPTDNAAMIAVAGFINHLRKKNRRLIAQGNLSI